MILFLPFNTFWHEFHCVWHLKITIVVQLPSWCLTLWTPWTTARQASLSLTISQSLPKFMSIESVMPSNHLILCHPVFLLLQSFLASGSFPMSQLFASGGQGIGVSASAPILPMNIQGWFPLGLTGLITLQSKGLLRVFSSTTVQKHQFFGAQLSSQSNSQWAFVGKVMSLLLNMLSRLVTTFLPRSKRF